MDHSIFYYPYGNFQATQTPLLKVAALYFDKLNILDPLKASGGSIGSGEVEKDIELLEEASILERIEPDEVLHKYENAISEAIRADLRDQDFVELCERSDRQAWTVALAKIPRHIRDDPQFEPKDKAMQRLMGRWQEEIPNDYERHAAVLDKGYAEVILGTPVFDEYREMHGKNVEYRYADYPLPLGESIMVNHALFAGLLHAEATPLTDDPFHNKILSLKMKRARAIPEVRQVLEDRARQRRLRADTVAWTALRDTQLELPAMSLELPLEVLLEHRQEHYSDELEQTRKKLASLARRIREEPWSEEFGEELEHQTIPDLEVQLEEARRARDAWINSKRGRLALKGTGVALGATAATISLVLSPTPLLPVAVVIGLMGLAGGAVVPGIEVVQDWIEGKKTVAESGLHYLATLPETRS